MPGDTEKIEALTARLKLLQQFTQGLTGVGNLAGNFQQMVHGLRQALHAEQVHLELYDPVYKAVHSFSSQATDLTIPGETPILTPLFHRQRVLGVLTISMPENTQPYSAEDREFVEIAAGLMSLAAETERTRNSERQQREQAETLREVAQILNQSLDQTQILEMILDQLARVVEYDSASIMLLSGDQLSVVANRRFVSPEQLQINFNLTEFQHIQRVVRSGHPVIITDTHRDERWNHLESTAYIRCWLGVPLVGKDQVIGLLNLDKSEPGFYSEQDASLAAAFANQAATAIENARLYTAERQRVGQMDALHATIADISAELTLPNLLQAILKRAVRLLEAVGGDLGLYDENRNDLVVVASHNMGRNFVGTRMAIGEGAMGQACLTRQPVIVDEYAGYQYASAQYSDGAWQSVIAVPFLFQDHLLGAIGIVDKNLQRHFTEAEQHLLSLFAQHAAIAVENARLFQDAQLAAERRAGLHRISQEIVAVSLEPEDIYEAIHKAAASLMPAEAFVITKYDEARQTIEAVYLQDRGGRYPPQTIPANRGLAGQVVQSGKAIYLEDISDPNKSGDVLHFGDAADCQSALAVPMRLRGKVVGTISAQSYKRMAYSADDQELLEMLSSYAAIALDNASLFQHVQQLAVTDPVTGIANRRLLFETGQREFQRARRFGRDLSVIMIDIDFFKQVNDTYGHDVGDTVLYALAQLFKKNLREIDLVGRYGGEEFTIILPETTPTMAREAAERARQLIQMNFNDTPGSLPAITVSMGIASLSEAMVDFPELVRAADTALYRAKNSGRNRVEVDPG